MLHFESFSSYFEYILNYLVKVVKTHHVWHFHIIFHIFQLINIATGFDICSIAINSRTVFFQNFKRFIIFEIFRFLWFITVICGRRSQFTLTIPCAPVFLVFWLFSAILSSLTKLSTKYLK